MSNISDHFFRKNHIKYIENEDFQCQLIDAIAIDEEPPEDEEGGGFSYNFKGEYTVYFFGVTKKSETVCIRVSGYQPSFFMNVPDDWKSGYNGDTFQLQKHLTSKDATFVDNWGKKKKIKWFNSRNIKLRIIKAKKFDGFQINEHHKFIEITFNSHIAMKQTYRYFESIKSKILKVPGVKQLPIKLYEADIDPLLRMCHKSNITPCSWIQLNKGRFTCVDESDKKSHCQYEFNVNWRDVHPYETDDIAPFLVASYDIECTSGDGSFPQPTRPQDKLIQIGTTVRMFNNPEYELNHIITLKSCNKFSDNPNTIVESYDTEAEVIMAWQKLIQRVNPDIITGYNILGFDYWYLYERAQMFGIEEEFGYLGKLKPDKFENDFTKNKLISKLREKSLSSSALGDNKMKILDMVGRVNIDLLNFVRRTHKFKSYKLDFVSTKLINGEINNCQVMENGLCRMSVDNTVGLFKGGYFSINMKTKIELADKNIYVVDDENYFFLNGSKKFLIEDFEKGKYLYVKEDLTELNGEQCRWGLSKDDVTPAQIFEFQDKDAHHRAIVAKYCVQDCRLCNILMDKLCVIPNEIGMGQTCCVPLSFIFFRGQGIKVQSLVSRKCRKDGYLMPVRAKDTSGCSYKGATVLNACNGAHFYPVACLDFASLYPSCMLSHNLCIESVIEDKDMIKELNRQRKAKELIPVRKTKYQGDQFFYKVKTDVDEPKMIHLKNRLIFPCMWVDEGISYCYYFVQPHRKFDKDGNIIQDEHGQDIIDFDDRAILPRILKMLLNTRKATKKRMKKEKDPFKKKILDGLQLAYKITANSIYGATGASVGCISCKKVAGSVTMVGRLLLATSRDKILDYYEGSKCVYGDTDSVFINFKVPDEIVKKHGLFSDKALDWTIKIAQESGELITHGIWKGKKELVPLPSPHDLEYEKTYLPFILFSKKRYAGWLYEFDTKEPKYLDCKGIILKRRDNCRFLKKIYEGCLYRILNNQLDDSISFLRKSLYDILNNHTLKKYPMSDFVISKTVKSLDKYKVNSKTQDILDQLYEKIDKLKLEDEEKNSKMIKILNEKVVYYELRKVNIAHVMLALRQKQRDPGNAFASNDRVPYCFIEVEGNQKDLLQGDIIETPTYITKMKISLDYLYYIERQLEKPIMQLFEQVDPRAAQLFKNIKRIGTNRKRNLTEITKFFIEVIEEEENKDDVKLQKKVKKNKKKKKKKKSRILLEEDSSSDIELPVRRRKKKIVRKKIK